MTYPSRLRADLGGTSLSYKRRAWRRGQPRPSLEAQSVPPSRYTLLHPFDPVLGVGGGGTTSGEGVYVGCAARTLAATVRRSVAALCWTAPRALTGHSSTVAAQARVADTPGLRTPVPDRRERHTPGLDRNRPAADSSIRVRARHKRRLGRADSTGGSRGGTGRRGCQFQSRSQRPPGCCLQPQRPSTARWSPIAC